MKFTHKLLHRICTDYDVPVPEIQRGTPSNLAAANHGAEGICIYGWRGIQCLIVVKRTTDIYLMLHEMAHVIVGSGHDHDLIWCAMSKELTERYRLIG